MTLLRQRHKRFLHPGPGLHGSVLRFEEALTFVDENKLTITESS